MRVPTFLCCLLRKTSILADDSQSLFPLSMWAYHGRGVVGGGLIHLDLYTYNREHGALFLHENAPQKLPFLVEFERGAFCVRKL